VKSGISFVNVEGAKENLEKELPNWDFDKTVAGARKQWNDAVNSIEIEGGSEKEKEIFYTAMYHTMIDPRTFSDVNGNYMGADKKIIKTVDGKPEQLTPEEEELTKDLDKTTEDPKILAAIEKLNLKFGQK
jgi:putative alpha-1,2-mannosidase